MVFGCGCWVLGYCTFYTVPLCILNTIVKLILNNFDKAFENRIRLQAMSVLVANESYDFNALKDLLGVTDGNLASHLKALEKEEYISVIKSFLGRKPNTRYKASARGVAAFK